MKHMTKWMLVVAVLLAPMCAFAGVLDGTPFNYTGTVEEYLGSSGGMVLAVEGTGDVTIYGLGPVWFWEANSVVRPDIGISVTVTGYTCNDRNIAFSVQYEGLASAFFLRNADTGLPLWAQAQKLMHKQQNNQHHRGQTTE
jgi:hypothetical protein